MKITIRRFEEKDIPLKVEWVNNPENNRYLHYNLPLEAGKTALWLKRNKDREDRFDGMIEADGIPCGLIGLLSIDKTNKKAEMYLMLGEPSMRKKGISYNAVHQILQYAFTSLGLNKVFLFTETANKAAQGLFEKVGFGREGVLKDDLFYNGRFVDRYMYAIRKEDHNPEV